MADPVPQPLAAPGQASPTAAAAPNPEEDQKLLLAVQRGDIDGVRAALAAGADVNTTEVSASKNTPLHRAVMSHIDLRQKMYPIIDLLLQKGANVNAQRSDDGHTPFTRSFHDPMFFYALFQRRPNLTLKIKEPLQNREETPFQYATRIFSARPEKRYVANVIAKAEFGQWGGAIAIAREEALNSPAPAPAPASPVASVAQAVQAAVGAVVAPAAPAAPVPPANPAQDRRLINEVRNLNIAEITASLDAGANVNHLDRDSGYTPLTLAIQDSHYNLTMLPIIRLLLSRGAKVNMANTHGDTPLHNAAAQNNIPAIDTLLEAGADVRAPNRYGHTPREVARRQFAPEAETRLAAAEAPNPAPIAAAAQAVQAAVASAVAPAAPAAAPARARTNTEQDRALAGIVISGDDDAVRAAILAGANPNAETETGDLILSHYAGIGDSAMVEFLLAHGADVNMRAGPTANDPGFTALDYASSDDPDIIAMLRAAGGREGRELDGEPARLPTTAALFAAIRRIDVDAVRDLIARGVDVNAPEQDDDWMTPIQASAAFDERLPVTRLLVDAGANPAAPDAHGATPMRDAAYMTRRFLAERFPALVAAEAEAAAPVIDEVKVQYKNQKVFDVESTEEVPILHLLSKNKHAIFKFKDSYFAILRQAIWDGIADDSQIRFECKTQLGGTPRIDDVEDTEYYYIQGNGSFVVKMDDLESVLDDYNVCELTETPKVLDNVASAHNVWVSVDDEGYPINRRRERVNIVSGDHCQAGTKQNVFGLKGVILTHGDPAEPDEEEEEEEEEEEPNVVYVKKGEEKTEFPLDLAQTVLQLKEAVNAKLGIAVETQKLIFQGKVLKDTQTLGEVKVGKGYTIQLQVSGGRLTKKRSSRRGGRTVKQKRGTYKRHGRS